jgi:hypothetical protein
MKGITTLAALPSGSGCMSHLPAEVGEARKPEPAYRGQGWTTIAQVDFGKAPDVVTNFKECRWDFAGDFFVPVKGD